jgi:5'-3' exonuclease
MNLFVRAWHAGQPSRIHAVRGMLETLANTLPRLQPDYLVFALDSGHRERLALYPEYKAGRPPKPPEMAEQIELAMQVLDVLGWPSVRILDFEADDVLASFAEQLKSTAQVVLITSDKDAIQCQARSDARIYQPWGAGQVISPEIIAEKYKVPPAQFADYLALTGDSTDGIPGVAKIGPGTAAKLLAQYGSLAEILEAARLLKIPGAAGKNLRDQADLARLSRRLVELWTDLPIGEHWKDWPVAKPRTGWIQGLQELGLGAVARKLEQTLTSGFDHVGSPHRDIEFSLPTILARGIDEANAHLNEVTAAQERLLAQAAAVLAKCSPNVTTPVTSHDESNRSAARRVYDDATAARIKHGKPAASGYFAGTLLRQAWDAGSDGLPFESIDLTRFDQYGKPLPQLNTQPKPETRDGSVKRRTLF